MTQRIVLATRNDHKVGELRGILADILGELDLEIVGLSEFPDAPDVIEDGVTFAENATLKARASGASAAITELLLAQMSDVRDEHRGAGFVCAAVLVLPDGRVLVEEGQFRGTLARGARGANGFGYDPILLLADGRTAAELSPEEKNAMSHRGNAFRALSERFRDVFKT